MKVKKLHAPAWTLPILLTFFSVLVFGVINCGAEGARSLMARAKNYYYGIGVKQDFSQALQLYMEAARLGDAEARHIAGGMYFKGYGTEINYQMAFQLLHQAAREGQSSPESQQVLAQSYLMGLGTIKNYKKALEWYSLAAENGNAEAQNELGYMYFIGNGVAQDVEKGTEYFLQAAENGLAIAQHNMGIIYYTGNGVGNTDLLRSYAWMNIAAAGGHKPAIAARGYLETILSSNELAKAQSLTEELSSEVTQGPDL